MSFISLLSLISFTLGLLSVSHAEPVCPELLTEREAHRLIAKLTSICEAQKTSNSGGRARRERRVVDPRRRLTPPQWEVASIGWSINTEEAQQGSQQGTQQGTQQGAVGWRLYRPLTSKPDRLPVPDRPPHACRYAHALFERDGEVWMLERWSVAPPSAHAEIELALSHTRYITRRVYLMSSPQRADELDSTVASTLTSMFTPRGTCPSLTALSSGERFACGSGSPPTSSADRASSSGLVWRR